MGSITRVKLSDRIYTANDASVDKPSAFRHEVALFKQFPWKIFFFCLEPSPEGEETSILPSKIVVQRTEELAPEFVLKLEQDGFICRVRIPSTPDPSGVMSLTWKQMLKTDDEEEAEKRAREKMACDSVKFNIDGSADFVFGPTNPIKEMGGRRVWFKSIAVYTDEDPYMFAGFGDGCPFPDAAIDVCQKILEDIGVDVDWHKGDVLLVDNLTVQHAR